MKCDDSYCNVSNHPQCFDLEPVAEWDYSDKCYCFDTRIVLRHLPTGVLYTARDSGCSCPSPFETYTEMASLEVFNREAILREIDSETGDEGYEGDSRSEIMQALDKTTSF